MQKICCIGTHGTGKSTLCYQLSTYYKMQGKNVKLIHETARSCPFQINEGMSAQAAMWIAHTHMKKELEAEARKAEVIISDRSPIDPLMYAKAKGVFSGTPINFLQMCCENWMETYDRIILLRPDGNAPAEDGIRSMDLKFQKDVEAQFDIWLERCNRNVERKVAVMRSSYVFGDSCMAEISKRAGELCLHGH